MPSSTTARLAAFAPAPVLGGAAASVGRAAHTAPPFQDCLKVTAADAGLDADDMSFEAVPVRTACARTWQAWSWPC